MDGLQFVGLRALATAPEDAPLADTYGHHRNSASMFAGFTLRRIRANPTSR
jgi:hypothetical protein